MSNVVAFPAQNLQEPRERVRGGCPMTLFIHIKRATLIAHVTGRYAVADATGERVGKRT